MTSNTPQPISRWIPALAGAAAMLVLFQFFGNAVRGYIDTASLFYWWGFQWANPASESEHGWLILGLSGWLLWRNLGKPETGYRKPERIWPAVLALLGGLGLHALGFVAQQTRVSIVGFLLCAWGLLRLGGGRRWGDAAAFPLAFLLFAIPLSLLDTIGFWLRMSVVQVSSAIAHTAGIHVLRSGTQLASPDGLYHYDVAAACSGVRSLTALVALSLLCGYLNFASWRRRGALLLLCFPLVYIGNVARIVAIIFAAQWGGSAWGNRAHDVMGYGIFVIVLGGVLLAAAGIRRWWPEEEKAEGETRKAEGERPSGGSGGRRVAVYYGAAGLVVALAIGEMLFLRALGARAGGGETGVRLAADGVNPVDLPGFIGTEWIGQSAAIAAVEREILPPDTGYSRRNYAFITNRLHDVFLSIVLSGRDRTSIHRPELCLVAQGWSITGEARHAFQFPGRADATFPATLLQVRREVRRPASPGQPAVTEIVPQLVAYWFVSGDRVVATHWQRIALDAWNRVTRGRVDRWAYVLMQADARDGEAAAVARMQAVLDGTLPAFQKPLLTP